jgi:Ni,Fe-hydrogenase III small subunit/ferredoxin
MISILLSRIRQGFHTIRFPCEKPPLPEEFVGMPILDTGSCTQCMKCVDVCPTDAIVVGKGELSLDLGRCIFCTKCVACCAPGSIRFSRDHHLASDTQKALVVSDHMERVGMACKQEIKRLFGRSLKIRQVSAGGCNACELDTNVLNTLVFDLGRFGIQFVASPRHADAIMVTGPVTATMERALTKTYAAIPTPKLVIATGACAISGGIYRGHPEAKSGVVDLLHVDLFIPGCPPHPLTILDGLLRFLGKQ